MPDPTTRMSDHVHAAVLDTDERQLRMNLTDTLRAVLADHGVPVGPELHRDLHLAMARGIASMSVHYATAAAGAVREYVAPVPARGGSLAATPMFGEEEAS